jgi:hypothetical protein
VQAAQTRPPLGSSVRRDAVTGQPIPPTLGVRLAPAVTFALSLALYLRTLLPGMAFDDWGELQTVPHVLGISHPTGYPTYILTAWLFELLPIGSVAFRANLLAAVCVAVALAAMTSTTLRLGVRPAIAVAAAVATGAIGTVWGSAVVAEVNGLHLAFIALIVDRSLAWADGRRTRDLAFGGLLIGLSLGNHLLTAFVAPFFVLFALWEGRSTLLERKRRILAPVLAGLAGLAVYLYIPIAASLSPPLAYNHPTTFEAIRFLVTGEQFRGQYGGLFTVASLGVLANALPALWSTTLPAATVVLPAIGLVGLAILVVRRPAFGLACAGALLVGIYVWANYLRLGHYLLVPWLLLGLGTAVALEWAARAAEARLPGRAGRAAGLATAIVAAVLAVALVALNLPTADRSRDTSARTYVDAVFAELPENAAILSFWGPSWPLLHAQLVLGERPDVLIVDDTNIVYDGWGTREARIASLVCSRPVFMVPVKESDMATIRERYTVTRALTVDVGALAPSAAYRVPVYRIDPKPGTCP